MYKWICNECGTTNFSERDNFKTCYICGKKRSNESLFKCKHVSNTISNIEAINAEKVNKKMGNGICRDIIFMILTMLVLFMMMYISGLSHTNRIEAWVFTKSPCVFIKGDETKEIMIYSGGKNVPNGAELVCKYNKENCVVSWEEEVEYVEGRILGRKTGNLLNVSLKEKSLVTTLAVTCVEKNKEYGGRDIIVIKVPTPVRQ